MNRNLWGVENFQEIKIVHNRTAPERWMLQAAPTLKSYAEGSTDKLVAGVKAAKEAKVAADEEAALGFLTARSFSMSRAKEILVQGEKEEGHPPRSAWDMAQAITANARTFNNSDDRLDQELVAKKILDAVA